MSRPEPAADDSLAEEAARWFLRINEAGNDSPRCAEFDAWLARSERHREEYQRYQHLWGALEQVRPRRPRRQQALAGLLVLATAMLFALQQNVAVDMYKTTQIGEQADTLLADGSRIQLDGDTRIRVEHTLWQRRLLLEQGQIFIDVAPGLRPFVVVAADGETRDIGTRFNVRRVAGVVTVGVAEGRVEVRLPAAGIGQEIGAGEQISYRAGRLLGSSRFAAEGADAWTEGRWLFDDLDLTEVVAQINRRHSHPVRIDDPRLAAYRISGVFSAEDRSGLLAAIIRLYPLRLIEEGNATLIVAR